MYEYYEAYWLSKCKSGIKDLGLNNYSLNKNLEKSSSYYYITCQLVSNFNEKIYH